MALILSFPLAVQQITDAGKESESNCEPASSYAGTC